MASILDNYDITSQSSQIANISTSEAEDERVLIEKDGYIKPYVGGYKDTQSGKVYHNAFTQTIESSCFEKYRKKIMKDTSKLTTRETQTQELRNNNTQCYREYGTQMDRQDLKVDTTYDKITVCKPYMSSEALYQLQSKQAILIQKIWRIAYSKVLVQRRREARNKQLEEEKLEREQQEAEEASRLAYERERRLNPQTKEDFELLLTELDSTHKMELEKTISSTMHDPTLRMTTFKTLLEAEARTISSIDKMRVDARKSQTQDWMKKDLEKMASPLVWTLTGQLKGDLCEIETPESTRATQLLRIYNLLEAPVVDVNIRLDILQQVRDVITGDMKTPLLKDIYELIYREEDLLRRGRSAHMTQMRLRLQHLITSYIHNPVHNPAAGLPDRRVKKTNIP